MYTGAIAVSATETLQAIAIEAGNTNSPIATAAYTINSVLPAPTFTPAAGTYTTAQSVAISDATAGSTIYYTTNGVTPTTTSTVYSGPVAVNASETIQAIAVKTGSSNSAAASATYTIAPASSAVPAPTFSPAGGSYPSSMAVTLTDTAAGSIIYYTTDGTTPTASSTQYRGALWLSSTEKLNAIAAVKGSSNSPAATATYTIAPASSSVPAPTFSPAGGTYTSSKSVTLTETAADSIIYYTTDGTTPTASSTQYRGALWLSSTEKLNAIAAVKGSSNSSVSTATYTIARVLPAPDFSLAGGTGAYRTSQTVTISDPNSGATIYYTTNGTAPTPTSTKYAGPITVSATETVEAIAVQTGYANSAVSSVLYTIQ